MSQQLTKISINNQTDMTATGMELINPTGIVASDIAFDSTTVMAQLQAHIDDLAKINGDSDVPGSIKKAIADLIDAAPEQLDTLNEIAAALQDDANAVSTVMDAITTSVSNIKYEQSVWRTDNAAAVAEAKSIHDSADDAYRTALELERDNWRIYNAASVAEAKSIHDSADTDYRTALESERDQWRLDNAASVAEAKSIHDSADTAYRTALESERDQWRLDNAASVANASVAKEAADTSYRTNLESERDNWRIYNAASVASASVAKENADTAYRTNLESERDNWRSDSFQPLYDKVHFALDIDDTAFDQMSELYSHYMALDAQDEADLVASVTALNSTIALTEQQLQGNIDTLNTTVVNNKNELSGQIQQVSTDLGLEVTRATDAENSLALLIQEEAGNRASKDILIEGSIVDFKNEFNTYKSEHEASVAQAKEEHDAADTDYRNALESERDNWRIYNAASVASASVAKEEADSTYRFANETFVSNEIARLDAADKSIEDRVNDIFSDIDATSNDSIKEIIDEIATKSKSNVEGIYFKELAFTRSGSAVSLTSSFVKADSVVLEINGLTVYAGEAYTVSETDGFVTGIALSADAESIVGAGATLKLRGVEGQYSEFSYAVPTPFAGEA